MSTETTAPVQITQVLPPRDAYALADHEALGFAKREQLRRFLLAHHVPVVVDGHELRFTRADFLAGMARGARLLALAPRAKRPSTAAANAVAPLPTPAATAPAKPVADPFAELLPPGLRLRPSGTR